MRQRTTGVKPWVGLQRFVSSGPLMRSLPVPTCGLILSVFPVDIHSAAMYKSVELIMLSKQLVAASAEALILSLLSGGESYGYAIIQEIKARSKDRIEWTDGMLYPVLHRMEDEGWITSRWVEADDGRRRKYYSIKKDGKRALERQRDQSLTVHSALAGLWTEKYV